MERRILLKAGVVGLFLPTSLRMRPATANLASASQKFMLYPQAGLLALPTSGTAYKSMKTVADTIKASPWLPNYWTGTTNRFNASMYLASALVYARTGITKYRTEVHHALRAVIGTEDQASTDGTAASDRYAATGRQLTAWIMCADLTGFDRKTTGTRTGYTTTSFDTWLDSLRTKRIGTHSTWNSVNSTSNDSGNNHGAWSNTVRIAMNIYLGNTSDMATAVTRFRAFVGDRTVARTQTTNSSQWTQSEGWICWKPGDTTSNNWRPLSDSGGSCVRGSHTGINSDGAWVQDVQRDSSAYPKMGASGSMYHIETCQATLLGAMLLERAGYSDVWTWQRNWLKRSVEFLNRQGKVSEYNRATGSKHIFHVINTKYGSSYPTVAAGRGKSLGYTDWLYA